MSDCESNFSRPNTLIGMLRNLVQSEERGEPVEGEVYLRSYRYFLEQCLEDPDPNIRTIAEERLEKHFQGDLEEQAEMARMAVTDLVKANDRFKKGPSSPLSVN